jgi:hypothetical protein
MHRTTILLPEVLKAASERLAKSQKVSLGELIRSQLEKALATSVVQESGSDAIFSGFVPFSGKAPSDLALNHDDELYSNISEAKGPATSARKRNAQ